MKTIHHAARPARAKPALELPRTEPVAAPAEEEAFTACELDAAEQLLHLSESSSSSSAPSAGGLALAAARSSSSSSPRSVNTPPAPAAAVPPVLLGGCADWEEEGEHQVAGSQRRVKRYRLIAEIYAETEEIGGRGSRKNKKEATR